MEATRKGLEKLVKRLDAEIPAMETALERIQAKVARLRQELDACDRARAELDELNRIESDRLDNQDMREPYGSR